MKKLFTLMLSVMMVSALSITAFATTANPNTDPSTGNGITIEMNLKATNPTLASVDGPGATFNYAVASVTPSADNGGTSITDASNHTAVVQAGPANGLVLSASSISYPIGTAVNASAAGADNKKSITASADMSKFTAPGIYRYSLTQTNTSTSQLEATGNATRFVDVYVEQGASALEVSGIVIHNGATENGAPSQKQASFESLFETVNITLKGAVGGSMSDKNHEFPYSGTVTDNGRSFTTQKNDDAASDVAGNASGSAISTTLADGDEFVICGLSHDAAVTYTETNNTSDTYQVSIEGGTPADPTAVAPNGTKTMASTDVDNASTVIFRNTLDAVSPTGVIMRFGPYFGMIVIAAALLVMRKKATATK